ncbi:MAG: hypothetical protein BWY15_02163 [Firmicutes bacterium ADurb.Bin193]|nr:MAG: hypothetical protein BWY15_02163 [Firmicutes bacterium ADurb.Bin193]
MIRKVIPLILIAVLAKEVPLQTAVFDTETPEVRVTYHSESFISETPMPTPVITPTTPPVSARVASKQPVPTVTPTPTLEPTQEADSPQNGKYVEGFGYVEYSGPNQGETVDSGGDINKMVGYMGDEPKRMPKPTPEETYIPRNGDKEIDFQTGAERVHVEGQGFVPED